MTHDRFSTSAEAEAYVHAIGGSSIYTSGARPRLPRCDSPKFAVADDNYRPVSGKTATCECVSRDNPLPGCAWLTQRHAEVLELDGEFLVKTPPERISTETVDGVRLSRLQARLLTTEDRDRARSHWPVRESDAEYTRRRTR